MRKILLTAAAALLLPMTAACAATLALPGVVVTGPPSTSITCTETAASNLVAPISAGTVAFSCTVATDSGTWSGAASLSGGAPFGVTPPVGNAFNVIFSSAVTTAGTYQPGTLTTVP